MSEPHLAAHIVRDQPVFDIVYQNEDWDWVTINGWEVWPFWVEPFRQSMPTMPEGWMQHLQELADKFAVTRPAPRAIDISALIKPKPFKMNRRV